MVEIWSKLAKYLATASMGHLLVASQRTSQILQINYTNFVFYPVKIQLEIAEIWPKVAKQLATAILGELVATQKAGQIVLFEQTKFLFFPIKIQLEMAEIWPEVAKQLAIMEESSKVASHGDCGRQAGGQLDGQLYSAI